MVSESYHSLSLVIPCLDEQGNILKIIEKLEEIISKYDFVNEIIIVDGCSADGSQEILTNKFETLDKDIFKLILKNYRSGYGADIITGLSEANGDVLAWTHADLQTDIKDILQGFKFFQGSTNKKIVVKGKRVKRKILDLILSKGMEILTFFKLRMYLNDINAQPKMMTRNFFNDHIKNENPPSDFSLDIFFLYQAKRNSFSIKNFPVKFNPRISGSAKGGGGSFKNRIKLIIRTYKYINKLKGRLFSE